MRDEEILEVKDLMVRFYTYEGIVEALDGVNFHLKPSEILGVVGETGCGKSVTSLTILRLVPPPGRIEGGEVYFNKDGKRINIMQQTDEILRKIRGKDISMIFQEPRAYLNPVYSVKEQMAEVLLLHRKGEFLKRTIEKIEKEGKNGLELTVYKRILSKPNSRVTKLLAKVVSKRKFNEELTEEIIRLLKDVEIADPDRVARMYPHELSGGMAQRVLIAMALACNPSILIADEPTTNVDVTVQAQILNLIRLLQKNSKSSIIYITHDLGVVAEICERVAVMYAGNVVEIAEVFTIFQKPLHPYTIALLESIPKPGEEFRSIPGIVPSLINPPKGCRFHDRCSYAMDVCRKSRPPFIEVEKNHFVACYLYGVSQ
ncbi:MAG: ABC transporter ATP-binding protein [Candidatus Bathyarchaeia archaeon]|nr:ABC transporter ATP-binding protein [Candidatus Bathyarchaeia archaeon]